MEDNLLYWFIILVLILLYLELPRYKKLLKLLAKPKTARKPPKPRVMKPKSEKDCPYCRKIHPIGASSPSNCRHNPVPWSQKKGKGGPKKRVNTQNHFCANPNCEYYLIRDEHIHALVGYGSHGKYEMIQDLRCQACVKKFTIRKHTVLYRLKTRSWIVRLALNLLAVGMDISALEEAIEVRESTMWVWLARSGEHGRKLHECFFNALALVHIQLDELWANLKQAQENLWVWLACDAKTKIIPVMQVGGRTQEMAYSVVHELKSRLKTGCVPVFSSDGLKHYFYALTAHFGEWVIPDGEKRSVWMVLPNFLYGQVIKSRRMHRVVDVEQRMLWGLPAEYSTHLKASLLSGKINTSFVERVNLTIRQSVSKLTRRTWGSAQFTPELSDHLYWWLAYYHFSRYHQSLRIRLEAPLLRKGKQRPRQYRRRTPAVAAGLTHQRWSVMELISFPLP